MGTAFNLALGFFLAVLVAFVVTHANRLSGGCRAAVRQADVVINAQADRPIDEDKLRTAIVRYQDLKRVCRG